MSFVVSAPTVVCRPSRHSSLSGSSAFALAAPRARVSTNASTLRSASHRRSLQVVAMAKGKGKAKRLVLGPRRHERTYLPTHITTYTFP
eukprot:9499769-Pyramimonas_sp.AAC.2